jgi:hypothetical protein
MDTFRFTLLLALFVLAGCDAKTSSNRVPVSGTVSLSSGEKVNGRITFVPAEDRHGPAATTGLVNGVYTFDKDNGPIPGPTRVIVKKVILPSRVPTASEQAGKTPASGSTTEAQSEWTTSLNIPESRPFQHDLVLDR